MKRIINFAKALLLILILIAALLLVLPKINFQFQGQDISINIADDFLKPQGINISDFRKGDGLYSTSEVEASLPENTSEDSAKKLFDQIKERVKIAQLGDIGISLVNQDSKYKIVFGYPNYYSQPVEYTKWLTAKGDIYFTTSGDSPQILDVNDYDIDGEIKLDYSSLYQDHLSFYFKSTKSVLLQSVFQSGNQYFIMYIDNQPSFYIIDYDQYVDTNVNRVRAISTLALVGADSRLISDYINIARTYFASSKLDVNLTVSDSYFEVQPSNKPFRISIIALISVAISILPILLIRLMQRSKLSRLVRDLLKISIIAVFTLALLKFAGAIINIESLFSYYALILIAQVYILNIDLIEYRRKILLAMILFFAVITKLYFINYSFGVIGATMVIGSISILIGTYYFDYIDSISLRRPSFKKIKLHKFNIFNRNEKNI